MTTPAAIDDVVGPIRKYLADYEDAKYWGGPTIYPPAPSNEALRSLIALTTSLAKERDELTAALADPDTVHLNMLRGGIAKPSVANIIHLYGDTVLCETARADAAEREVERVREALQAIRDGNIPRPVGTHWRNDCKPSKHDKCTHGVPIHDDCGQCIDAFIAAALSPVGGV